ncbi:tetratricopeptide repeat protein [Sanyastnella coralliicola]|uniref:tetratricopeptide repeat protein n=1 Tax=Sanyastnella coralliicola TaxID=3069118 RepID=UPI0027B9232A|nr:tetratricopeptide repeat protein [Longitalea sp. SCSIO 12813]
MKSARYIVMMVFGLLMSLAVSAQESDIELAEYYFQNGQYASAKLYYEKIWKTNRTNRVYENYLATLIALEDLENAEKLVKKKIRSRNNNATAYVDLGSLYLQFGQDDKANQQFEEALKSLEPGRSPAIRLANSFIKLNRHDLALRTYEKGQRISKDGYPFHYEIANVNGMMGKHEEMVESFMDLLLTSPNYIQTVQNSINRNLNVLENEKNAEMLRSKLIKRTQRYPDELIYSEMLIWLFNQKKEFAASLIQAKAIDKRLGENGIRIMEIGQMARRNEDYATAANAFSYVVEKGAQFDYFVPAHGAMLESKLAQLESQPTPDRTAYAELANEYGATLDRIGRDVNTIDIMRDYAHINAFYLNNSESAITILEEAIETPGIYDRAQAMCKLELADILLLDGDIWEASLLYSQVELAFKEDVLGADAKFRNARISYFTGDFEWAQAQLDVLKASTSKLISNDAIDLSLLITDNYNMDTTTVPMRMFAQADLLGYQNRWDEAMVKVDSLLAEWPMHTLKDEILMMKYKMHMSRGEYEAAEAQLNEVLEYHFADILADDALYNLAEMYELIYFDEAKAQELYQRLLVDYPGSLYVVEARKRFRALRGDPS